MAAPLLPAHDDAADLESRRRDARRRAIAHADDGVGLPPGGGPGSGLGTQIVRTLITSDLAGSIEWRPRAGGGTEALIDVPLRSDTV